MFYQEKNDLSESVYVTIEYFFTFRGPSISGHFEGSARSPLPLNADCINRQFTSPLPVAN